MKILTAVQMAEVDRLTTEQFKIPSLLLMENAGRSLADELEKAVPNLGRKRILIFCGKGNNGGDGLVVGRYLALRGARPEILMFADPEKIRGDPLVNWEIVRSLGLPIHVLSSPESSREFLGKLNQCDVVVDALFGTGLTKPIGPEFVEAVEWINRAAENGFVAAVDIPSGLFADSPEIPGPAVSAHLTVTFSALKLALVVPPAADRAGRVVVAPIGSPPALLGNPDYRMNLIDSALARKAVPPRARDSHKGSYGHLYIVAGSRGKSGAALMTGLAALRSGAGLVTVCMPESLQHDVVGKVPELMTESLPESSEGTADLAGAEKVLGLLEQADALVIGPGMTTNDSTRELIRKVVHDSPVPVVIDADGLNAFASRAEDLRNGKGQPLAITPHPGEMARLMASTIAEVQKDRLKTARDFAESQKCFVILKGFQTVVADPMGHTFINSTGNPGMATGGSGDILSGIAGRFVAGWVRKYRGKDLMALAEYLSAAVYFHGLAGDLAAAEKGMESMIATDLLPHLPEAFKKGAEGKRGRGEKG